MGYIFFGTTFFFFRSPLICPDLDCSDLVRFFRFRFFRFRFSP